MELVTDLSGSNFRRKKCPLSFNISQHIHEHSASCVLVGPFSVALSTTGSGVFLPAFTLSMELAGAKYRTPAGIWIEVPFAIGEALAGVFCCCAFWRPQNAVKTRSMPKISSNCPLQPSISKYSMNYNNF